MKIKKYLLYLFAMSLIATSCNSKDTVKVVKYDLVANSNNILVEKFDVSVESDDKYNWNNKIFKPGSKFIYDFSYSSPEGKLQSFTINKEDNTWEFTDADSKDGTVIQNMIIGVLKGNPMAKYVPDYNQTALSYTYKEGEPFSMSGAIENESNIWIHPPREDLFKILELNPFPYIKAPFEVGNEWEWDLVIGNGYQDERWALWEGTIRNQMNYKIIDYKTLETELGKLDCFVIESEAKSEIGESSLKAFFNPKYGFVKLDYTNIDGSKILLNLIDYIFN